MVKKKPIAEEIRFSPQYLEQLLNWELWVDRAGELLEASKVLEPHVRERWEVMKAGFKDGRYVGGRQRPQPNLQGPYFILVAYAVENLFKAVIIRKTTESLKRQFLGARKFRLPTMLDSHNLVDLAEKAGFVVNPSDEDLLTRLSRNSVWAGRYPVPIKPSYLRNVEIYSDGKPYLTAYFSEHDTERVNALVERVKVYVNTALSLPKTAIS